MNNNLNLQPPPDYQMPADQAQTAQPPQSLTNQPTETENTTSQPPPATNSGQSDLNELLKDTYTQARGGLELPEIINDDSDLITPSSGREFAPAFDDVPAPDSSLMTEEESRKHTRTIMDMREVIQSMGLSLISDGNLNDYKQYYYTAWAKNLLIDAWHPIIRQYNLKVNPYLHIGYAELVASVPLGALAFKNRKLRLENEAMAETIRKQQEENAALKDQIFNQSAPGQNKLRNDTKNQWKIDSQGYFVNDRRGDYVKDATLKEKVELTQESYALLIKHNDPEKVNKIFKISGV